MFINAWLIHDVKRRRPTGVGDRGDVVLGAEETIKARVEFKQRMVRSPGGREIVSTAAMATMTEPRLDDSYLLPSIAGHPAGSGDGAWRSPANIEGATTKAGNRKLWMVYFA